MTTHSSPTIEIRPVGGYLKTDVDGFIINPTASKKISPKWQPAVTAVVDALKQTYGEQLIHIYIKGSVPRGLAIDTISDVDVFAYVRMPNNLIDSSWTKKVTQSIRTQFPFMESVEIRIESIDDWQKDVVLLNQALCIYGDGLANIPKIKPGIDTALWAPKMSMWLKQIDTFLLKENPPEKVVAEWCTWFMKRILRTGCELVAERSGKYTRDLYFCYEVFSEFYPEKEAAMHEVLTLALNPTTDAKEIRRIREGLCVWLFNETQKVFLTKTL